MALVTYSISEASLAASCIDKGLEVTLKVNKDYDLCVFYRELIEQGYLQEDIAKYLKIEIAE